MATNPQLLQVAIDHHRSGRLAEAAAIYRQILAADPRNSEAMHLLGVVSHQCGEHATAIRLITGAIHIDATPASYYGNLGEAYRASGQLESARTFLLEAIARQPQIAGYHYNLALVHAAAGEQAAVIERCRRAIALQPNFAEAHNLLGVALRRTGQASEAIASFERALACKPSYFEALVNLAAALAGARRFDEAAVHVDRARALRPDSAEVHVLLGDLRSATSDWPAAIALYEQAVQLDPKDTTALRHWGMALQAQERFDEAVAQYQRALDLAPQDIETRLQLAATRGFQRNESQAIDEYRRILDIAPTNARALTNLSSILQQSGRSAEAIALHDQALARAPEDAFLHFSRAVVLLAQGDLSAGWDEYRWRTKVFVSPAAVIEGATWDGTVAPQATLLVHGEQGMGDAIQFVRFLPLVRQRVGRTVLVLNDGLVPLFKESGYGDVQGFADPLPPFDYKIPLLDLAGVLGVTLQTIPRDVPYLRTDSELVARWRRRLAGIEGLRVGICWQGNPRLPRDHDRSIPLTEFAALANVPLVRLVSLQKGPGSEQIEALGGQFELVDLRPEYDVESGAFMNAAAVMQNLDLVLTVDTAIAHLAGALGVPVWVALPTAPDWRWMLDRDDSPWYPTMRLFRQVEPRNWPEVFVRIAAALRALGGHGTTDRGTAGR